MGLHDLQRDGETQAQVLSAGSVRASMEIASVSKVVFVPESEPHAGEPLQEPVLEAEQQGRPNLEHHRRMTMKPIAEASPARAAVRPPASDVRPSRAAVPDPARLRLRFPDSRCERLVRSPPGRDHDLATYRWRRLIENVLCGPKQNHRIATRYDDTDQSYAAFIHLAAVRIALGECPRTLDLWSEKRAGGHRPPRLCQAYPDTADALPDSRRFALPILTGCASANCQTIRRSPARLVPFQSCSVFQD